MWRDIKEVSIRMALLLCIVLLFLLALAIAISEFEGAAHG